MNLTLPNLLSVLRLGLVPVFIIAVLNGRPAQALAIMAVAGLTDVLDGYAARYLKQQSLLGSYLDPIADKLLMTAAFVVLAIPDLYPGVQIPVWVTILVITRDIIILCGVLVLSMTHGAKRFPPTALSKINTALLVAGVLLVLSSGVIPSTAPVARTTIYLVAIFTVASGLQYAFRLAAMRGESEDGPIG